jgi:hypothetical protein
MRARGPKPSGSIKISVRLNPDLIARLKAAGAKRGKNVSREIETRLNRSLADEFAVADQFGNRQVLAVARMVFAAAKATANRGVGNDQKVVTLTKDLPPPRPAVSWLNDPAAYDAAVATMIEMFALIRPGGAAGADRAGAGGDDAGADRDDAGAAADADAAVPAPGPDRPVEPAYRPAFNALELLREIETAPLVAPARASRHVLATIELRRDIGDEILDRAGGVAARARSAWAKDYGALRRKQAKAPDTMSNEELARMRALQAEANRLV